jgi:nitrogen regulatory protein PII-like uncharacterized protein
MEKEITELVNRIAPAKGIVGGFMSRNDIIQLISKVADEAVLIGWSHAESMTRKRMEKKLDLMEQEMTIIKEQMKSLEMDLLAAESK